MQIHNFHKDNTNEENRVLTIIFNKMWVFVCEQHCGNFGWYIFFKAGSPDIQLNFRIDRNTDKKQFWIKTR